MKMPSIEYIQLVNEFGKTIQELRGLKDDEIQELKFKINNYVEEHCSK
jgi:hypothetical protein